MSELLPEAQRLLAVAPDRFVAERRELAAKLREEGRAEDAAIVARLAKPSAVVSAVNRAARDRPKVAKAAVEAAVAVKESQLGGNAHAFQQALGELDSSLDLLADVALAHVARPGKAATEGMRRRVRDLLRSAVADDDARDALARGALTEELGAPGFSVFAGMSFPKEKTRRRARTRSTAREKREAERRETLRALRDELEQAEKQLQAMTKAARDAERARERVEREVDALRRKLARVEQA